MARTQDYRLGEFTFPRGWFVVAAGSQIGTTPHSAARERLAIPAETVAGRLR